MSEYRAIYKCRLCGESFVDYVHAKDEDAAAKKVIDFSLVYSGAHVSRLKVPRNFQVHSCNDGSYGKGSCLWASEVEEFPIAVTRIHFPEKAGENNG